MSKFAWKDIDWALVQARLFRQQRRVYKASMEGNRQKVHALQRRIILSLDAKLFAVKQVLIENQEHLIPAQLETKKISDLKQLEAARKFKFNEKLNVLKTFCKAESPRYKDWFFIIKGRIKQQIIRFALEPEWESIFEPNSHGYRPRRSYNDSVSTLIKSLKGKSQYIYHVDIQKCFYKMNYEKLLQKIATFELIENQIKVWLTHSYADDFLDRITATSKIRNGIHLKKVIFPLLINITLHGLENYLKDWYAINCFPCNRKKSLILKKSRKRINFSRYNNGFIILVSTYNDILQVEQQVEIWFKKEIGLLLPKTRTKIINSTLGFEFLGFQIISIKIRKKNIYKIKIHPSKSSKIQLVQWTRETVQNNKSVSSYSLIRQLSNEIIHWSDYFRFSEYSKDFGKIDYIIFNQIRSWAFRRKSKGLRSRANLKKKYFPPGKTFFFRGKNYQNNWILIGQSGNQRDLSIKENFLPKMMWTVQSYETKIKN